MAEPILDKRLLGYIFDRNFVRFRQRLAARSVQDGRALIVWNSQMEYFHRNEIRVHHGRRESGENVEVIIVNSRNIGASDALAWLRRDPRGATLVVTATAEQAAVLRRENKIGAHGFAMVEGHVPLVGEFGRAALICVDWFDLDALVDELFFPVTAIGVTENKEETSLAAAPESSEAELASAFCI